LLCGWPPDIINGSLTAEMPRARIEKGSTRHSHDPEETVDDAFLATLARLGDHSVVLDADRFVDDVPVLISGGARRAADCERYI
jgi:hypothetical protein